MKKQNLIGRNIGRLRYQHGWTQDMLAAKLQLAGWMISRSKISRIESDQAHVYDFQVFVFADVFDVEAKTLFQKRLFNPTLAERDKKLRQFRETRHPHKMASAFLGGGWRIPARIPVLETRLVNQRNHDGPREVCLLMLCKRVAIYHNRHPVKVPVI